MMVSIRPFADDDPDRLVEILRSNGQYGFPDVEGPEAMRRFSACEAAVFLVAESGGQVKGLIRAVYDGSRALIHLLSVDPDVQSQGVGKALLAAVEEELKRRGAPSVAVTVTETSAGFWETCGYGRTAVQLMLKSGFGARSET